MPLLILALLDASVPPCWAGSFLAVAPKGTKRACPAIRPYASLRVRSLHRCSEGRLTRAVPGPLSLSPHPCGSPLYATIPLTLLKGRLELPDSHVPSPALTLRVGADPATLRTRINQRMDAGASTAALPRGAWERSMRAAPVKAIRQLGARTPSGGRVEVLRRGTRGRTPSEERRDRDVPS